MNRKEIAFLILLFTSVVGTVSMIPGNTPLDPSTDSPSLVSWDTVTDDPNQTLSIQWMGIPIHVGGHHDAWIIQNLESQFNIDLEPIFMDANGYNRRRPLILIGGDVPDVMWDGSPLSIRRNLRNGFIMEVPYEVILKYAPTYVDILNREGKEAWLYGYINGKNYGLPTFDVTATGPRIGGWRQDWLTNVGIGHIPATIETMGQALYRFRHNDPDGNGRKDTYGWSPDITHWSLAFTEVFAAYDTLAFDFIERDGQVVWGGVLPEAKQALKTLHSWFKADLLSPDFMLHTRKLSPEFVNGKSGYTYPLDTVNDYDRTSHASTASRTRALNAGALLAPAPPLRNADGQRRGRTWGGAAHVLQFGKHLENEPEKVIRILKMIEAITKDPKLYSQARFGKRGTHWTHTPEDGRTSLAPYNINGRLPKSELLPETNYFFPSVLHDLAYLSREDTQWRQTHQNQHWGLKNVLGKSDVLKSAGTYLGDLRTWQMTAYIEMIIGERPIESFNHFVQEWEDRGGRILTQEANQMFPQVKRVYTAVGVKAPEDE